MTDSAQEPPGIAIARKKAKRARKALNRAIGSGDEEQARKTYNEAEKQYQNAMYEWEMTVAELGLLSPVTSPTGTAAKPPASQTKPQPPQKSRPK